QATPNPALAIPILEAYLKLGQIKAGLDFHGHWTATVPIWTFDYLQQVATQYCQLAVRVEQTVIQYWDHADQARLTRTQLAQHVPDCGHETDIAEMQFRVAQTEQAVVESGRDLANLRAADAQASIAKYQEAHELSLMFQATSYVVGAGHSYLPYLI